MTSEPYITEGARRASRRLAWSLVVLFAVTAVIGAANLIYTTQQVHRVRHAERSACGFYAHLADLPISVNPVTRKATLLAVQIVSDARVSWRGLGCPGTLPPPAPSFVKWAAFFKLPVS